MPDDKVRVEYPEGDYSKDIGAADEMMGYYGMEDIRRRKFPERLAYSSADLARTHKQMQEAAEEGMRLRRARKRLHEFGEAAGSASSRSTKRPAKRKRD